jgi:hypothetical protein
MERQDSARNRIENFKDEYPLAELIWFSVQLFCALMLTIVSMVALLFEWGPEHLWIMLLSGALAYIMPAAQFRTNFNSTTNRINN